MAATELLNQASGNATEAEEYRNVSNSVKWPALRYSQVARHYQLDRASVFSSIPDTSFSSSPLASLVPRPWLNWERGPGTHCLRMCEVSITFVIDNERVRRSSNDGICKWTQSVVLTRKGESSGSPVEDCVGKHYHHLEYRTGDKL